MKIFLNIIVFLSICLYVIPEKVNAEFQGDTVINYWYENDIPPSCSATCNNGQSIITKQGVTNKPIIVDGILSSNCLIRFFGQECPNGSNISVEPGWYLRWFESQKIIVGEHPNYDLVKTLPTFPPQVPEYSVVAGVISMLGSISTYIFLKRRTI